MKSYTDIEQSKKLAEILPLESADMCFINNKPQLGFLCEEYYEFGDTILQDYYPCWNLAALLNVIPEVSLNAFKDGIWTIMVKRNGKIIYENKNNPVDACVELIIKLKKENLL